MNEIDTIIVRLATGRREFIRLYRPGEIDDETLRELERDLDPEKLSAISAKADGAAHPYVTSW